MRRQSLLDCAGRGDGNSPIWQYQAIRRTLRNLWPLSVGWIVATGFVLLPFASVAAEESVLDSLQAHWRAQAPWCSFHSAGDDASKTSVLREFASKNEDGAGSNTSPCNDGDSIMFNALLCLAGVSEAQFAGERRDPSDKEAIREVGCDVVKHSQTLTEGSADYGRWWRSPRRNYLATLNQQPEGGSETTFSNDHALGVIAYIAQTRDIRAFEAWTNWIKNKGGICTSLSCMPGLPRYCPDDRCGFKIADCLLLDQLAKYLGRENVACASDNVKKAQSRAWALADVLLLPFKVFLPKLNDITNKYGMGTQGVHSTERIAITNSIANDEGYPLHDVAVTIYLLRKFGLGSQAETQMAADIVYARADQNAFFDFLANGPTSGVKEKIVGTCPSAQADLPHPKFQWTWERRDIPETAKKTMYWDCLFITNAVLKNDYPAPTSVPGMVQLAVEIAGARKIFHAACDYCKAIDCSGRDIDCGHKTPFDKLTCEANKKQTMMSCEGTKFVCSSTCSQ